MPAVEGWRSTTTSSAPAALVTAPRRLLPIAALALATAVIPAFYPSPAYESGLAFGRASLLVARNLALLLAWALLLREQLRARGAPS